MSAKSKATSSKSKGGGFERDIAKRLTLWCSGQSEEYYFWRTPGSGSVSTIKAANEKIAGDIQSLHPSAAPLVDNYIIECKKGYPSISFDLFLKNNKSDEFVGFWKKLIGQCAEYDKKPMLIYNKKGSYPTVIGFSFDLKMLSNQFENIRCVVLKYNEDEKLPPCYIYELETVLELIDYKTFIKKTGEI